MIRYTSRNEYLGSQPVLVLENLVTGTMVRIAKRGATLLSYKIFDHRDMIDIADGYRDESELLAFTGSRFAIMFPFANRIGDAEYIFNGSKYNLVQSANREERSIRHGFVRDADFEILSVQQNISNISATFACKNIHPELFHGYPFSVGIRVTYTLHDLGLDLEIEMHNHGDQSAPCFAGWHPYFKLDDSGIDHCILRFPANNRIVCDDFRIPLMGSNAYARVDLDPTFDFRNTKDISKTVLDVAYANLKPDVDGLIRTRIEDPTGRRALNVWQQSGVMMVFTGDNLEHGVRRSIALEPMEALPNAFNRADSCKSITLLSGATRIFRCGVEVLLS
jgi:aldose 1-epimerase